MTVEKATTNRADTPADAPKWEKLRNLGGTNYILNGGGFYISFNPSPGILGVGIFASDDGGAETALCYDGRFDILNGDFRSEYEALVPQGLDACKEFYNRHKDDAGSSWTTSAGDDE